MSKATTLKWDRVAKHNPCPVCGKPDWCLISRGGKTAICARIESDKPAGNKGAGWIHTLDAIQPLKPLNLRPIVKQTPKATPDVLNMTYHALLAELTLSETHRENLQRRRLTDTEIEVLGYKTLPNKTSHKLLASLQAQHIKLLGVPGFYLEAEHWWIKKPVGIAIPIRDIRKRIVGLQVRCDKAEGGRYKWVSSRGFNTGCSPGSPVHVAGKVYRNGEVWITEGPLKADIAALKLNRLVLAVAGVGNWQGVIPILRELKPERVIIAFDMDKSSNQAVKLHTDALMTCLIKRGMRTFEADWDTHFKGLDDLLAGGQLCQR